VLRVIHGNRVEELLAQLIEALPPADPFAPATIVVGSKLIARWLGRELAFVRGVAAGLDLLTFDRFVERVWAGPDAERQIAALDRGRLATAFASVLADRSVIDDVAPVAAYLDAGSASVDDRGGPRRVQLAEHLASLTWNYALSRPDWMPALIAGQVPAELAGDPTAHWQARLICGALARLPRDRRWAPLPMLPWLRRRVGLPTPRLDAPVSVFGMSFLARSQLEALTDLGATTDVSLYIVDPCEELWDDVGGRRDMADATKIDPLPLMLWGKPVRDTLASLVERTGGDLEGQFSDVELKTARDRLLADVRARKAPDGEIGCAEAGVRVLACPNARRELEVIADAVRGRLDADPSLSAHEIAVWIAGDSEYYLAQARSAFEAIGVPCHLIDAPIDDRGRIGEAVLSLLELPTSQRTRRDLLRVMTHPAVLAAHPHVDAADWVRWTERLGIAHGANAEAHANTYLADVPGNSHFHWDQGVRRLALGAFMVGERPGIAGEAGNRRGPAKIGGDLVAPEELRPDQHASAATYALLVRSLCADAAWLASYEAPLARWAEVFAALVDQYLAARDREANRDLERARSMLAHLAKLDVDGRVLGFREAREHVIRQLAAARAYRGEPLATGVMISPLAAMRAVPFRIAFVCGLDEGRSGITTDRTSPLDLRREPRPGDVSPRDRDRAAFLDVLLCTREALYLTYVAVEPNSGQPLGPSSIVLELADALAPYLGAASSRDALESITTRYALHRFTGQASRESWACDVRDRMRTHLRAAGHPVPDEDGQLALLGHPSQAALRSELAVGEAPVNAPTQLHAGEPGSPATWARALTIGNLRGFLEHPVQAWAQAVLGLDELPDDAAEEHDDEPFHLERPKRASLLRDVFALFLREEARATARSLEECYLAAVTDLQLRGQFPLGVFAEAARTVDLRTLATWRQGLGQVSLAGTTRFGFGRAWSSGAELRPAISIDLRPDRVIRVIGQTELLLEADGRYASVVPMVRKLERRTAYHLRGAFDHLVLAAAGIANGGHSHFLLDPQGHVSRIVHSAWSQRDARNYLAALAGELLDASHGYLLPFDALAKALGGRPSNRSYGDPTFGLGYGPIERRDGLSLPTGPESIAIAQRRLRPLIEHMHGDHGFEISRSGPPQVPTSPRGPGRPPQMPPPPQMPFDGTRNGRPILQVIKGGKS
jgi:exodeoxyribonuclease V gamma subunit